MDVLGKGDWLNDLPNNEHWHKLATHDINSNVAASRILIRIKGHQREAFHSDVLYYYSRPKFLPLPFLFYQFITSPPKTPYTSLVYTKLHPTPQFPNLLTSIHYLPPLPTHSAQQTYLYFLSMVSEEVKQPTFCWKTHHVHPDTHQPTISDDNSLS